MAYRVASARVRSPLSIVFTLGCDTYDIRSRHRVLHVSMAWQPSLEMFHRLFASVTVSQTRFMVCVSRSFTVCVSWDVFGFSGRDFTPQSWSLVCVSAACVKECLLDIDHSSASYVRMTHATPFSGGAMYDALSRTVQCTTPSLGRC